MGGVRLMNIHKSKGLEFPIVILAGTNSRPLSAEPAMLIHSTSPEFITLDLSSTKGIKKVFNDAKKRRLASEAKRLLYVALTRAKNNLYIHTCTSSLASVKASGLQNLKNMRQYLPSGERTLLLTLKDVWLSDFAGRQNVVSGLMSGDSLSADETGCRDRDGRTVLKFSSRFKDTLAGFIGKGYSVSEAWVNFIVWWKGEGMDREIMVVLPGLKIIKS